MATIAHDHQLWLIQPLLDAGLELDEVRMLVVRLVSAADIADWWIAPSSLTRLVSDRPPEVRAAWIEVIDRMIASGGSDGPPDC